MNPNISGNLPLLSNYFHDVHDPDHSVSDQEKNLTIHQLIDSSVELLEEHAKAVELAGKSPIRAQFGKLSKDVGRLDNRGAEPILGQIYDKQVRGHYLETYEIMMGAAKHELNKSHLSLTDRVVLLDKIKVATKNIEEISRAFYENHPHQKFTVDQEGVQKVLIETKEMLEANIVIIAKELKKNEAALLASSASLLSEDGNIEEKSEHHNKLQLFNATLKGHASHITDELNKVLKRIAANKGQTEIELQPDPFLKFVSTMVKDADLKAEAEEILDITKEYKKKNKKKAELQTDAVVTALKTVRNVLVAKGKNRIKALKEGAVKVMQIGAVYGLYLLVDTFAPAIITKIGMLLGSLGALAGVANPVGAIILGIAISGVTLYGIGLLLRKNKAHIVRVFTPIINAAQFIGRKASRLFQSMKTKIAPDIHIPLEKRSIPRKDSVFVRELKRLVYNAKLSHQEIKLKEEIRELRLKLEGIVDEQINQTGELIEPSKLKDIPGYQQVFDDLRKKDIELSQIHEKKEDIKLTQQIDTISEEIADIKEDIKKLKKERKQLGIDLKQVSNRIRAEEIKSKKGAAPGRASIKLDLINDKQRIEASLTSKQEELQVQQEVLIGFQKNLQDLREKQHNLKEQL